MKDSLKVLERVKKFEIDEQRRVLMQKLEREDKLQKGSYSKSLRIYHRDYYRNHPLP